MTDIDPFAGGVKVAALSFKDQPVGATVIMQVTGPAKLVQSRDFETGEPAYWDEAHTQPKMSAVVNGTVDGEERALWAQKPSAMFTAIAEAQTKAGERIAAGGTLKIKYTGDKPNAKNPRLNAAKQYAAIYEPPAAGAFDTDEPPF